MKYIAVYSWGGIISIVKTGDDLNELIRDMNTICENERFDGEEDDARIFEVGKPYDCIYNHDSFDISKSE